MLNFRRVSAPRLIPALLILAAAYGCSNDGATYGSLYRAPAIPNVLDGVTFESGDWTPHLEAGSEGISWGNHRAVVTVDDPEVEVVVVTIPWRRHDADPASKTIVVVDVSSGEPVQDALPLRVENVSGDVAFRPNAGSRTYHVY